MDGSRRKLWSWWNFCDQKGQEDFSFFLYCFAIEEDPAEWQYQQSAVLQHKKVFKEVMIKVCCGRETWVVDAPAEMTCTRGPMRSVHCQWKFSEYRPTCVLCMQVPMRDMRVTSASCTNKLYGFIIFLAAIIIKSLINNFLTSRLIKVISFKSIR